MATHVAPLWGDTKYNPFLRQEKGWQKIALCAYRLEFVHPKTKKQMNFEIEIPEEPIILSLDRLQFSRVVTNLINNALKHNAAGTMILLQLLDKKDRIQIVIKDNGSMIAALIADRIFEPFVVADASRESKGGSGLGLSIAKKIVEMHGGTIELLQDFERQEKSFVINIRT